MEPKSPQLVASLLIDRRPPSIAYRNSLLGSGFALESNARVGCASILTTRELTLGLANPLPSNEL